MNKKGLLTLNEKTYKIVMLIVRILTFVLIFYAGMLWDNESTERACNEFIADNYVNNPEIRECLGYGNNKIQYPFNYTIETT